MVRIETPVYHVRTTVAFVLLILAENDPLRIKNQLYSTQDNVRSIILSHLVIASAGNLGGRIIEINKRKETFQSSTVY